jgi:hypothetical protein
MLVLKYYIPAVESLTFIIILSKNKKEIQRNAILGHFTESLED